MVLLQTSLFLLFSALVKGNLIVTINTTNTWNDGTQHTQCTVKLTNTGSKAICGGQLELTSTTTMERVWNLVETDPTTFHLPSWIRLQANGGEYADIGMIVAGSTCPTFKVVNHIICYGEGHGHNVTVKVRCRN